MILNALRYFAIMFAIGFVLGALRTLVIAPRTGATVAVLMEMPLMLAASWLVAHRIVRRAHLPPAEALGMGVLAFLLLMMAEAALATTLGNQSLARWSADLIRTPGWIGLTGQAAFGLFPLAVSLRLRGSDIPA